MGELVSAAGVRLFEIIKRKLSVTHNIARRPGHFIFRVATPRFAAALVCAALAIVSSGLRAGPSVTLPGETKSVESDAGPVRLALLPFVKGENVSDFEYEQVCSAFYLALSRQKEFEIVPRFELMRLLQKAEEAGEDFESEDRIYTLAADNNIDLMVFGSVGAVQHFEYKGVNLRTVGLKVEIANVLRKQVFNTVAWSTSHLSGENIQQGEKISGLSTMAAAKLTWQSPDFFPVQIVFDPASQKAVARAPGADEAYKDRVRSQLLEMKLPPGAEIDSVLVNVREKKEMSGAGVVGCLTLVGWLFVPMWEVEYNLDMLVRVKYLNEEGVQYSEFADAGQARESFHFTAGNEKYEKPTVELLNSVGALVHKAIRNDRKLFIDRSELLRKLFQKDARPTADKV